MNVTWGRHGVAQICVSWPQYPWEIPAKTCRTSQICQVQTSQFLIYPRCFLVSIFQPKKKNGPNPNQFICPLLMGSNGLKICLVDHKAKIPRDDHSEQKHLEGHLQTFHHTKEKLEKDEVSWFMTGQYTLIMWNKFEIILILSFVFKHEIGKVTWNLV